MKKKKRPERPPERPIEISNLIDEHIERGELPLPFGGEYLNQGGGQLGLGLESIAPKDQKNNRGETVRTLSLGLLAFAIICGAFVWREPWLVANPARAMDIIKAIITVCMLILVSLGVRASALKEKIESTPNEP